MEVESKKVSEWGGVLWSVAAAALLFAGFLDTLLLGRNLRVEFAPGRNSTDQLLKSTLGIDSGTSDLDRLLGKRDPIQSIAIVYPEEREHVSEAALAISVAAWPAKAKIFAWDQRQAFGEMVKPGIYSSILYLGPEDSIPGYDLKKEGPFFGILIPKKLP